MFNLHMLEFLTTTCFQVKDWWIYSEKNEKTNHIERRIRPYQTDNIGQYSQGNMNKNRFQVHLRIDRWLCSLKEPEHNRQCLNKQKKRQNNQALYSLIFNAIRKHFILLNYTHFLQVFQYKVCSTFSLYLLFFMGKPYVSYKMFSQRSLIYWIHTFHQGISFKEVFEIKDWFLDTVYTTDLIMLIIKPKSKKKILSGYSRVKNITLHAETNEIVHYSPELFESF